MELEKILRLIPRLSHLSLAVSLPPTLLLPTALWIGPLSCLLCTPFSLCDRTGSTRAVIDPCGDMRDQ